MQDWVRPPEAETEQPLRLRDVLGPGLITGASDDDPSGIATYSQAGAQFGYGLGWTLLFTYPLMCAIQLISAQIGRVTGRGLAGNMRRHYPAPLLYALVALLVVANTINIGADLGAMGAALRLLIAGPTLLYVAGFAIVTVLLEVFVRYSRYAAVLRWLTLSLFAYVGDGVRCRRALADRGARSRAAAHQVVRRLPHRRRRGARHHDQPVSVFLAGRRGGRGRARKIPTPSRC